MTVRETALPGVLVVTPRVFHDERGVFFESYKSDPYEAAGITCKFVQDNVSISKAGVIRGLHHQFPEPQAKLVQVLSGAVLDVAVNIRRGSPTFGKWVAEELSGENRTQLFIPAGFAHGFAVLQAPAILAYKCSAPYNPAFDSTILWSDPDIGIDWPTHSPIISAKDADAPLLRDVPADHLAAWRGGAAT